MNGAGVHVDSLTRMVLEDYSCNVVSYAAAYLDQQSHILLILCEIIRNR